MSSEERLLVCLKMRLLRFLQRQGTFPVPVQLHSSRPQAVVSGTGAWTLESRLLDKIEGNLPSLLSGAASGSHMVCSHNGK